MRQYRPQTNQDKRGHGYNLLSYLRPIPPLPSLHVSSYPCVGPLCDLYQEVDVMQQLGSVWSNVLRPSTSYNADAEIYRRGLSVRADPLEKGSPLGHLGQIVRNGDPLKHPPHMSALHPELAPQSTVKQALEVSVRGRRRARSRFPKFFLNFRFISYIYIYFVFEIKMDTGTPTQHVLPFCVARLSTSHGARVHIFASWF